VIALLLFAGGFGSFVFTVLELLAVTLLLIVALVAVAWVIGTVVQRGGRRRI
jgi:hypothetical protein